MPVKGLGSFFRSDRGDSELSHTKAREPELEPGHDVFEVEVDDGSLAGATALAASALAEASRLNDLYIAAAAEAHSARSEAGVLRDQLVSSQEFAAKAYAEAQRMNGLLLDAQAEAAALRVASGASDPQPQGLEQELVETRLLLQQKIQESQDRFDYAQVAWKEAARINDLYVEATRRAFTSEQEAASLEKQLADIRVGQVASRPAQPRASVVEMSASGPLMQGAWALDLGFDEDLKALDAYVGAHRTVPKQPDIAVLLMFPGWENELRGNRWHVAKFLSSRMPVVLVQPAQLYSRGGPRLVPERRLKNTWILETLIHQPHWPEECDEAILHARDVDWALRRLGGKSPLYWLFSPYLAKVFVGLTGGYKLVHATEDWVDFPGLARWAKANFNEALATADLVVAVSDGVRQNLEDRVDQDRLITVANGCDYVAYSAPSVHRTFKALRATWKRIAVFAGNIDYRIDFGLLKSVAEAHPGTLFVLIGPIRSLDSDDSQALRSILRLVNVRWFGPFDPDLLPSVYAGADVGMIPYKHLDFIVRSNFSLKLLEMAAAGLPVVTTAMDSVRGLAAALVVTDDSRAFLTAMGQLSRCSLTEAAAAELRTIASGSDYATKFAGILKELEQRRPPGSDGARPRLEWDRFATHSVAWRSSLNALAAGDTAAARLGLIRNARSLRQSLGRRHATARKALIDLSKTMGARPGAMLRFLTAALSTCDEDLSESPAFRAAAIAHCATAVTLQRYRAAAWSGRLAWAALQAVPGSQDITADLVLNLLTALVEDHADSREIEAVLKGAVDLGFDGPEIRSRISELLGDYLKGRPEGKPRTRSSRTPEVPVHGEQL